MTNQTDAVSRPDNLAPYSAEAEEAFLGAVIINEDMLGVCNFLQASDFFIVKNAWVYEAILAVKLRREDLDTLTLISELRNRDQLEQIGGSAHIVYLVNSCPTHVHAETYARMIAICAQRRRLLAAASEIAQFSLEKNADVKVITQEAVKLVTDVSTHRLSDNLAHGSDLISEAADNFLGWLDDPREVRGYYSGIPVLDKLTGGLVGGRVYTIYGATGMGKSTLAAFIAISLMRQAPGLVVTTEMDSVFWIHRAIADLSGIPYLKLQSGQLNDGERKTALDLYGSLSDVRHNLSALRLANPTVADIHDAAERLIRADRCEWVLVDSVNNIAAPGTIYDRTSAAADGLLSLAIDQSLVVINTSQTGRNAKDRSDKRPRLNDAEGSGKIEQNSYLVLGLYWHEYYVRRGEAAAKADHKPGRTELIVLKHRIGGEGKIIPLKFTPGQGYVYDDPNTTLNNLPAYTGARPDYYHDKESNDGR